ncbi:MAG: DUF5946 family protein [Candidatus Competibacteraceae bacterium]
MKTSYQQAIALQQEWVRAGHDADICRCYGAHVPNGVQGCFELYTELAMRPTAQAAPLAASTYRVNAHALQHPEIHGKTTDAVHGTRNNQLLPSGVYDEASGRLPSRMVQVAAITNAPHETASAASTSTGTRLTTSLESPG